ncbi:pyridoxal-phosphate dependent enzyme [Paracrocinitomix mangrovi]|uniref:1-aminocyclopropane-1-carboxylate deaminase/D-cysteine desulfhydrase n=1 Tax=Paracrocinitomix mangrovi TaxID=2862509 RepID=UPI001C8E2D65|nr:pyridoxal-phosphate dependent enzyme [Paracrocinitomix mangrovi]UKN02163.1 pyridoxal-phosphate dependent enzyme [Paracrocinitomix mangrovi]
MKLPSPLQEIKSPLFEVKSLKVYVKRDDLIDPIISGNKWRKLKFNVEKFKSEGFEKILTFGGAYSNHIAATARAGKELGISTIGIIRGDELSSLSNLTLQQASNDGMELVFTRREEYDLREEKYYHEELRRRHGHVWIVPEGGANFYGVLGCEEITKEIKSDLGTSADYLITACGTGTTATGLLLGTPKVIGVSALKGGDFIIDNIYQLLFYFGFDKEMQQDVLSRFDLQTEYHFNGYAKYNEDLIDFIKQFQTQFNIPLEQVYTGKMFYALFDLIEKDYFPKGSTIIALHTGGLQGKLPIL